MASGLPTWNHHESALVLALSAGHVLGSTGAVQFGPHFSENPNIVPNPTPAIPAPTDSDCAILEGNAPSPHLRTGALYEVCPHNLRRLHSSNGYSKAKNQSGTAGIQTSPRSSMR